MLTDTPVVVDIECFRFRNKEWIVKEISVCADFLDSIILQQPYPLSTLPLKVQKAFAWLTGNLHGISWSSGDYPYSYLQSYVESVKLRYPNSPYFAKGFEKCIFLSQQFDKQFNDLEDLGCPSVIHLPPPDTVSCVRNSLSHSLSFHCARKKSSALATWLQKEVDNGNYECSLVQGLDNLSFNLK